MRFFLYMIIFGFTFKSLANTKIIECRFSNPKYVGSFSLDAVGQGFIHFRSKNTSDKGSDMSCPLTIKYIQDVSQGISPSMTVEFFRNACQLRSGTDPDMFTRNIALYLDLLPNDKTRAKLNWLKEYDPESCKIKNIRLFDLRLNAKKFKKGLWGKPIIKN